MSRRHSIPAAAIAAMLSLAAPLAVATAASAAPGMEVLMFAHPDVNDMLPGEEAENFEDALLASGANVTRFDGGGGTVAAWEAALDGIDVLAFPEVENGEGNMLHAPGPAEDAWMTDEAAAYIAAWVSSGGHVLFAGSFEWVDYPLGVAALLSEITGRDYTTVWDEASTFQEDSVRAVDDTDLPEDLPGVDGTYPIEGFTSWDAELLEGLVPIYTSDDGDDLFVGVWTVGSGSVSYSAYDYFGVNYEPGDVDVWNAVNAWLLANTITADPGDPGDPGEPGEPADGGEVLPATGAADTGLLIAAAFAAMMLGIGLVAARRRGTPSVTR